MVNIFILLVLYQFKHYLADYLLQGKYMLGKFRADWGFIKPLLAHVAVHGSMTLLIAMVFTGNLLLAAVLAAIDMAIHFTMDRLKAGSKYLGRFKAISAGEMKVMLDYSSAIASALGPEHIKARIRNNTLFWWSLGLDQMVHHLTHYFLIYEIVVHI